MIQKILAFTAFSLEHTKKNFAEKIVDVVIYILFPLHAKVCLL